MTISKEEEEEEEEVEPLVDISQVVVVVVRDIKDEDKCVESLEKFIYNPQFNTQIIIQLKEWQITCGSLLK